MRGLLSPPLIRKELRDVARGPGLLVVKNVYLLAVAGVAAYACLVGASGQPAWDAGRMAFWGVAYLQAVLGLVVAAALTSSLVTAEREQKTLDILATTPISTRQIVAGKLLGALSLLTAVFLVGVPVAAACFLFGGVGLSVAVQAELLLCAAVALGVGLGLYCSSIVGRTVAATSLAVGAALLLTGAGSVTDAAGPLSPLTAVGLLASGTPAAIFGGALPVLLLSIVYWGLILAALVEGATQALRHPSHRRLWGTRVRFGLLAAAAVLVAVGSLALSGGSGHG
jgi:ABC-type Na+ efflux pump permease subunit